MLLMTIANDVVAQHTNVTSRRLFVHTVHYGIPTPPPIHSCAATPRPSTSRALLRRRLYNRGYECLRWQLFTSSSFSLDKDSGSFVFPIRA